MPLQYTNAELERQAAATFNGLGYRMFLANDTSGLLTGASLATAWLGVEVSGSGYAPVTGVLSGGALNTGNGRWEQPEITWGFEASGIGFTFTHRCLLLSTISTLAIESVAVASNVATVVTTTPHGFAVGDSVVIDAATRNTFDGTRTVASVPAWDSFTFALTATNLSTTAETGTVVKTTRLPKLTAIEAYSSAQVLAAGQAIGGTTTLGQGILS
jgi:hypothetical protein